VIDGFYAVPRGGVEIGGVLFGILHNGNLTIRDFRTIKTEYLTGPSFHLSGKDQAGLWELLTETRFKDPAIHPVGWFVSHSRNSGIELRERELEIYHRFFPDVEDVVLVLKPDSRGRVRGGYFFRGDDGAVKADATVSEFWVEPYWGEKGAPPEAFPVDHPDEPIVEEPPVEDLPDLELKEQQPELREQPELSEQPEIRDQPAKEEPAMQRDRPDERPEPALPELFKSQMAHESGIRSIKNVLVPVIVVAAVAAALAGYLTAIGK
jgi:hypothetical protein